MCPNNYKCNENNYCCETSKTTKVNSIGQCVNGRCPVGYTCENDNKCYIKKSNSITKIGPPILDKCVNDRCPAGYSCGVGNLCFSNKQTSVPSGPYVLGKCNNRLCSVGYTCGDDNYCYANNLPLAQPEVLGRCLPGRVCPSNYTCSTDDFCHRAIQTPKRRPLKPIKHRPTTVVDEDDDSEDLDFSAKKLKRNRSSKREIEAESSGHTSRTKKPHSTLTKSRRKNKATIHKPITEDENEDDFISTNQVDIDNNEKNSKEYSIE